MFCFTKPRSSWLPETMPFPYFLWILRVFHPSIHKFVTHLCLHSQLSERSRELKPNVVVPLGHVIHCFWPSRLWYIPWLHLLPRQLTSWLQGRGSTNQEQFIDCKTRFQAVFRLHWNICHGDSVGHNFCPTSGSDPEKSKLQEFWPSSSWYSPATGRSRNQRLNRL